MTGFTALMYKGQPIIGDLSHAEYAFLPTIPPYIDSAIAHDKSLPTQERWLNWYGLKGGDKNG